jgi:hypothetical protein
LDALHGPWIPVSLRPEPFRAEALRRQHQPVPAQIQGVALIDTGARQTCIHDDAGRQLYQQVGACEAYTPSTPDEAPHLAPVYWASLAFPDTSLPVLEQSVLGMRLGYTIVGRPVLALLGRDFLAAFRMVYDGPAGKLDLDW